MKQLFAHEEKPRVRFAILRTKLTEFFSSISEGRLVEEKPLFINTLHGYCIAEAKSNEDAVKIVEAFDTFVQPNDNRAQKQLKHDRFKALNTIVKSIFEQEGSCIDWDNVTVSLKRPKRRKEDLKTFSSPYKDAVKQWSLLLHHSWTINRPKSRSSWVDKTAGSRDH